MKIKHLSTLIFLSFLMSSCISKRYIDIHVLKKGSVKLPPEVENVWIVKKQSPNNTVEGKRYYSIVYDAYFKRLSATLPGLPHFSKTNFKILDDTALVRTLASQKLNSKTLIIIQPIFWITIEREDPEEQIPSNFGSDDFTLKWWTTSIVENKKLMGNNYGIDTVCWVRKSFEEKKVLPSEPFEKLGEMMAADYSQYLAPNWVPEERMIYHSLNSKMLKAYKSFTNNDLNTAQQEWENVMKVGTRDLASKAAYNLALLAEINDNLDISEKYLTHSLSIKSSTEATDYLENIRSRKQVRASIELELNK
jgi:hypothetical protein